MGAHKLKTEMGRLDPADEMNISSMQIKLAMAYCNVGKLSKTLEPLRQAYKGIIRALPDNPSHQEVERILNLVDLMVNLLTGSSIKKAIKLQK